MATISNPKLVITRDSTKQTARCVVTATVQFTKFEMNQMSAGLQFKLKCELWGADWPPFLSDKTLYVYPSKYFPDATPTASENVTFDVTLGYGVLDEDCGTDEIYARLHLINLYTTIEVLKFTNTVTGNF